MMVATISPWKMLLRSLCSLDRSDCTTCGVGIGFAFIDWDELAVEAVYFRMKLEGLLTELC